MVAKHTSERTVDGDGGLEGRVLADRYRIVTVVSAGANTVIADAFDTQTDQPVTFKIVRPELAATDEFRREFSRRAETATALAHPNIAMVLDWGETDIDGQSTVFWVVEYLGGGSLRDLFDRGRLLEPSQALVVGLEACRALDAAHQRGIAHTELTPSKLVFGEDRRLRIIDFGMAELLGRKAWEEPATVATHVARYASPEQALGGDVDVKSDVYALALSLLEAVTGNVPFSADSTVSTLAARVGKLMTVSADLGSLASVLERAGRPEPEDRFTAAEFGRALVQAAEKLSRPEPIPIVAAELFDTSAMRRPTDPTGGIERPAETSDPTVDASPIEEPVDPNTVEPEVVDPEPAEPEPAEPEIAGSPPVDRESAGSADAQSPTPDSDALIILTDVADPPTGPVQVAATTGTLPRPTTPAGAAPPEPPPHEPAPQEPAAGSFDRAAAVAAAPTAVHRAQEQLPAPTAAEAHSSSPATEQMPITHAPQAHHEIYDEERPRRRAGVIVALSLFVVAGLTAVAFAGFWLLRTKSYEVPDLVGVQEAVARNEISGNGWVVVTETERSDEQPVVNAVIRTFPAAGAVLEDGAEFRIFVSEGPLFRVLPDVTDMTSAAAQAELERLQLSSFIDGEEFDEVRPIGTVISWVVRGDAGKVSGDEVLPGTNVALTVSKGPSPRIVPNVVGATLEQATAAAISVQLTVVSEDVFSDDVPVGVIVAQDVPAETELPRDGSFGVSISKGPDLIALPTLDGLSFTEAQTTLTDAGFTIGSLLGTTDGTFESISISAEPLDGLYPRGTSVDLIFL